MWIAHEVISSQRDGLLVQQDPPAIAEALLKLLMDPGERRRMGAAGQDKVRSEYGWERVIEKTEQMYRSVVG